MDYKDLGTSKLIKFWHSIPETLKVGIWVGISAGLTGVCAYILKQPELFKYYGITNIVLFFIKEINKERREK